jgi:hypothetical protein
MPKHTGGNRLASVETGQVLETSNSVINWGGLNGQFSNNKLLNATDMSQKDVMKLRMAKTLLQPQAL